MFLLLLSDIYNNSVLSATDWLSLCSWLTTNGIVMAKTDVDFFHIVIPTAVHWLECSIMADNQWHCDGCPRSSVREQWTGALF